MTREEFDKILYQTRLQMGDMEDAMKNEPGYFDISYEQMKHLPVEKFREICNLGLHHYRKGKKLSGLN